MPTVNAICPRVDNGNLAYETLATGTPELVVIRHKIFRETQLNGRDGFRRFRFSFSIHPQIATFFLLFVMLAAAAIPAWGREKDVRHYGEGLIVNIPLPEPEVAQVVEEEIQNTIIRGSKEYIKDEYIAGAAAATSTPVFSKWTEGGKVFYKVRKGALNPWNFKDSADVGTLAVRYVVKPQGDKNTVLRIDALFVEDFRHSAHPSDGSVEGAEYKDIQDRLASIELVKQETAEALQLKQEHEERLAKEKFGKSANQGNDLASETSSSPSNDNDKELLSTPRSTAIASDSTNVGSPAAQNATAPASSQPPPAYQEPAESLDQHVAQLRQQLERLVKRPGAPLKSAPFHTASTLKSLKPGDEVLIVITTSYWYGVETRDGDHGWMLRDQLEQLP